MKLSVAQVDLLAGEVKVLDLVSPDGADLPTWTPGAHVDLQLGNGLIRQYSLCGDPADSARWSVAVRRDANSRGGSSWLHDVDLEGVVLETSPPRNNFPLVSAPSYLFLAGGIGITPFLPLCSQAVSSGSDVRLAFGGPSDLLQGFRDPLTAIPGLQLEFLDAANGPVPVQRLIAEAPEGTAVYCCGPASMIQAVREFARARPGITLQVELFAAVDTVDVENRPITVELAQSGFEVEVSADESILDAVAARGVFIASSCREGTCGTCEVAVLAGKPDHRDAIFDADDPERDLTMMICVSRAMSDRLTLDL